MNENGLNCTGCRLSAGFETLEEILEVGCLHILDLLSRHFVCREGNIKFP